MKHTSSAARLKVSLSLTSAMPASLPAASSVPVRKEKKLKIKLTKSRAAVTLSWHRSPV
jgi:hypothetical protein